MEMVSRQAPNAERRAPLFALSGTRGFEPLVYLLKGDILNVRGHSPAVSEGIGERAVAISPGLIRERHTDFGAGFYRLFVEAVYVFDIEMDPDRCAADAFRSKRAHLRDFVVDEEYRIADLDR